MSRIDPSVCAVMVTYNRPRLAEFLISSLNDSSIRPNKIVVVDNSDLSDTGVEGAFLPNCEVIPLGTNIGPAAGFNLGIRRVLELEPNAKWILLLDDDDPPKNHSVIEQLIHRANSLPKNVGGVGLAGGVLSSKFGLLKSTLKFKDAEVNCDYLAGGYLPLYRARILADARFDESLFFGFEELSLGLRIKSSGFRLVACNDIASGAGYGHLSKVYSSERNRLRDYYSSRNSVIILRQVGRCAVFFTTLRILIGSFRIKALRVRQTRARLLGLVDGLRGRGGACKHSL